MAWLDAINNFWILYPIACVFAVLAAYYVPDEWLH